MTLMQTRTVPRKILVTSALPYVNNIPHLGNMCCIIAADIYTRFLRSTGVDVISVLGTDEHGSTTEIKAVQEGKTPQEITDLYFAEHQKIYTWFNTAFDCFGRTSSPENHQITQEIFADLDANGFITSHTTVQLFDEKAQKFLPDRFVEGTCPHCQYAQARGDQCDNCGSLLDPQDLINPVSVITKTTPVPRHSTHLYIDLPKLQDDIVAWVDANKQHWSLNARTTTQGWLERGLKERCITRDLSWGVPVLKEGYTDKVFYSWFDAPIGYISITKENRDDWKEWWQHDAVELVQFMGKDNIPFHTILFPAFLMGTKKPWTLLKKICVNEFLNYKGGKFSKSKGVGVFGDGAMHSGLPADAYRFYITAVFPDKEDTVFDWDDFAAKYNNELIANFANLTNRTLQFVKKFYDGTVPSGQPLPMPEVYAAVAGHYGNAEHKLALKEIMAFCKHWNTYFQNNQPWKLIDEDPLAAQRVIAALVHAIRDAAIMIAPIMPQTATSMLAQLGLPEQKWDALGTPLSSPLVLNQPQILFEKLEAATVESLKAKFSGAQQAVSRAPSSDAEESSGTRMSGLDALDLRVGRIVSVEPHPNADKLFVEQIDMGGQTRQIVSGLRGHYTPDELLGKHVVVIANLKPASLRGVASEGMLLAAQDAEGNVGVVEAPHSAPGSQVFGSAPYAVVALQVTIDAVAAVRFRASDNKVFADDQVLQTKDESLTVDKGITGPVR